MTKEIQQRIEAAWESRDSINKTDLQLQQDVASAIQLLDEGKARVAEPTAEGWQVNQWLKKAVLLYFRLHDNQPVNMGGLQGYDKVPLKFTNWSAHEFVQQGARVVPPAAVRKGALEPEHTAALQKVYEAHGRDWRGLV